MLELVRLQGYGTRKPAQLSGGQQQRVALARSLAPHPSLLLLDEPLSALDRNLRRSTREELVRLRRALGIAFILVTHDQEEALTMAHRVGVMHEGRLIQVGTPAEVYERPNSRLVAEFLGSANLLPVTVRDGTVVLADGTPVRTAAAAPPGAKWLAIRPERMTIGCLRLLGEPGAANRLTGVVTQRFYAGEALTHVVRLGCGAELRATLALRQGMSSDQPGIGTSVVLSWQPDACIVLTR
jgi:ABC-type Fe3+/spermidine/putrescine transport system ATPase subunit